MTFDEQLNKYISILGCSAKELADASGLSASVLSRYRTGARSPEKDTEQFERLVHGISVLAKKREHPELTEETVRTALTHSLEGQAFPYEQFQKNLDTLLSALPVNIVDLARSLNFDSSYISRIRNGQRKPSDPLLFSEGVARFITNHTEVKKRGTIATIIGCKEEELFTDSCCLEKIVSWLTAGQTAGKDILLPFLSKIDEFDLNDFIRSIHFDELKIPSLPFRIPASKNYYGTEEMKKGTLDFFKATVLSKSELPLIANDDTPMAEKAKGSDFMKKFIFAVALTLKKGLHIHFIHNINRPFDEMMMGLEGWIPMYMTGQISPYYLKGVHNKVFGHYLFSSGAAALSGECITDYPQNGKMYLTNNKTELAYYRQRAEDLLSKASPLMEIYRSETEHLFSVFVRKDIETPGNRRSILSSLPVATLSEDLLVRILAHNDIEEADKEKILRYASGQRSLYRELLSRDCITEEIPVIEKAEYTENPMLLSLSDLFYERDVVYTYEEYLEHMELTKAFSREYENYTVKQNSRYPFRNIQIRINEGNWVTISKSKAPAIHFVIYNPQLRTALENMVVPVFEDDIKASGNE